MTGTVIVVEPTLNATLPVAAVTDTTTPSSTVTPTATPLAPGAILFEEDFENGLPQGFRSLVGNWTVMEEDTGNKVLDGDNRAEPHPPLSFSFGSAEWTDYALDFDMKLRNPTADVIFYLRSNPEGYYAIRLTLYYSSVGLNVSIPRDAWSQLKARTFIFNRGVWYHVRLEVQGENLRVFIDDKLHVEATDSHVRAGDVSFGLFAPTRVQLDNMRVTLLGPVSP